MSYLFLQMFSNISFLVAELNPTLAQTIRCLDKEHNENPEIALYAGRYAGLLKGFVGSNNLPRVLWLLGKELPVCELNSALRLACKLERGEIIDALVKDGRADLTAGNQALLRYACARKRLDYLGLVVALPNTQFDVNENEPLRLACRNGFTECVRILLERDEVDTEARLNEALRSACRYGHTEIVRLLLECRQGVSAGDCDNEAIQYACGGGHLEIVRMLLLRAEVNPANHANLPLRWAFIHYQMNKTNEKIESIIRLLLENPTVLNASIPDYVITYSAYACS